MRPVQGLGGGLVALVAWLGAGAAGAQPTIMVEATGAGDRASVAGALPCPSLESICSALRALRPDLDATIEDLPNVRLADLDGDGNLDFVLVATSNTMLAFLSNLDGTLRPLPPVALGNGEPEGLAIGDIDGDKRPDVAITDVTGHTQILGSQCP